MSPVGREFQLVVRRCLRKRKLSQGWLAGRLGISRQAVNQIISGKHSPRLETMHRVNEILAIRLEAVI